MLYKLMYLKYPLASSFSLFLIQAQIEYRVPFESETPRLSNKWGTQFPGWRNIFHERPIINMNSKKTCDSIQFILHNQGSCNQHSWFHQPGIDSSSTWFIIRPTWVPLSRRPRCLHYTIDLSVLYQTRPAFCQLSTHLHKGHFRARWRWYLLFKFTHEHSNIFRASMRVKYFFKP